MSDDTDRAAYFWMLDYLQSRVGDYDGDPEVETELNIGADLGSFDVEQVWAAAACLAEIFLARYAKEVGAHPEAVLNGLRDDLEKRWP